MKKVAKKAEKKLEKSWKTKICFKKFKNMLFKAEKNTYQVKQGYEKLKSDQEMSDHSKHQTQKPMLRIPSKNARDQKLIS